MSRDYFTYEHTMIKHEDLMARAEIERQLQEAQAGRPGLVASARNAIGTWLITLGERLAKSAVAELKP